MNPLGMSVLFKTPREVANNVQRMPIPARISMVMLGVEDLSRSVAFYEALGWKRSSASSSEVAFFPTADSVLALFPFDDLAADARLPAGDRPRFRGVTLAINVESAGQVVEYLAIAEASGGSILKPVQPAVFTGVSGYFADPDGYPWEVAYNADFQIGSDGSLVLPR